MSTTAYVFAEKYEKYHYFSVEKKSNEKNIIYFSVGKKKSILSGVMVANDPKIHFLKVQLKYNLVEGFV